jgi:DNA topoisomerase-3
MCINLVCLLAPITDPPFESMAAGDGGGESRALAMPCTTCPHPTCRHSLASRRVMPCPECPAGGGHLVLDPVSAPRWRLDCNRCSFLVYLPPNLHAVHVLRTQACEVGECLALAA